MFETRITAAALQVETAAGFPRALDALAEHGRAPHRFLRAAWYAAAAPKGGRTLTLRRADGKLLAAVPTMPFGPALLGARKVPGCYWPFRNVLAGRDATALDFAHVLAAPEADTLGPVWRLGPVPEHDPAARLLIEGAQRAGWSVLTRRAGTIWTIDLAAQRARGWPSKSARRKLRRYQAHAAELGTLGWRQVRGTGWSEDVLAELAAIEAASWIGTRTDGSGAKFLHPHQRALWRAALADPVLAEMLSATILLIDDRPVAFTFDMDDGPVRYGIGGGYDAALRDYHVGKLVNYRALGDAIAAGQNVMDLGAGDSGYKREMGAVPSYDLVDHLVVRSGLLARVLAPVWARQGV